MGINAPLSENVSVYGEVALRTAGEIDLDEDLEMGTKIGVKYTF